MESTPNCIEVIEILLVTLTVVKYFPSHHTSTPANRYLTLEQPRTYATREAEKKKNPMIRGHLRFRTKWPVWAHPHRGQGGQLQSFGSGVTTYIHNNLDMHNVIGKSTIKHGLKVPREKTCCGNLPSTPGFIWSTHHMTSWARVCFTGCPANNVSPLLLHNLAKADIQWKPRRVF